MPEKFDCNAWCQRARGDAIAGQRSLILCDALKERIAVIYLTNGLASLRRVWP